MRTIRVFAHISLDGVISPVAPDEDSDYAHGGWTAPYRTPAGASMVAESYGSGFDLLLGRRTYDLWARFWPNAPSSPIADGLNAATKYVATHRPEALGWGPVGDLGADVMGGIRRLKSDGGPDLMVCGSTTLTPALFEQGLVDEVVLCVYPVLLGPGKRFFPEDADPRGLALVGTRATPSGVLLNHYRYAGPLPAQPSSQGAGARVTDRVAGWPVPPHATWSFRYRFGPSAPYRHTPCDSPLRPRDARERRMR